MIRKRGLVILYFSLCLSLILAIIPMPEFMDMARPHWALLVLIYWSIALPHLANVGVAFITGFLLDILLGSTLGVHAGVISFVVYISASNYQKIRNFSVWQQALVIGLLSALYDLLLFWLERIQTGIGFVPEYMLPTVSSMFFWPWVFLILRKARRQFKVQ